MSRVASFVEGSGDPRRGNHGLTGSLISLPVILVDDGDSARADNLGVANSIARRPNTVVIVTGRDGAGRAGGGA